MKKPSSFSHLIAVLFLTSTGYGVATPWQTNAHGQVRVISPYTVAPQEGEIYFGLQFKTQKDWHVYWRNPGDSGYAPRLKWAGSQGFSDPQLLWPAPHYYMLPGDLIAIGYSGDVVYPICAEATGRGDKLHAVIDVDYLTCGDSCVPYHYKFTLDLPTGQAGLPTGSEAQWDPETRPLLERAKALLPVVAGSRPDILLESGLYQLGKDLYFEVRLPASLHASVRHVELFLDAHPDLIFRNSQATKGADGRVIVKVPVQVKDGHSLPRETKLTFTLNGLSSQDVPLALEHTGVYRAFPAPVADQAPSDASASLSLYFVLVLGFLGGLILNIMPCVLPILSIKLFGLWQHSGESRRVITRDALASAAGIILSFLIGGAIAILAREAGLSVGWGVQFQDPRFVAFLAIIVTLFALNLWGVFEIILPPAIARWGAISVDDEGAASHFMSGMFATLLATPCSAPFLGTSMAFALSQPASTTLAIFAAAGIGMAFPYFVLAAVPHTLHWLPKPGAWTLRVRVILGFFLAATLLWLCFVLTAQLDHNGLSLFYAGLALLLCLAWGLRVVGKLRQSPWAIWLGILMLVFAILHGIEPHRLVGSSTASLTEGSLVWEPFDLQKLTAEVKTGKSVFVDVTADWCFTCKYNEKVVLNSSPMVQAFQQQGIVLMKADWTNRDAAIGNYLKSFNRYGIPFYALYRPDKPPVVLSEFLTQGKVLQALQP